MSNISTTPDAEKSFQMLKIAERLSKIKPSTLYGTIIKWGLANKPLSAVCKLILDQFREDPQDVLRVVGQETLDLIKAAYKDKSPA